LPLELEDGLIFIYDDAFVDGIKVSKDSLPNGLLRNSYCCCCCYLPQSLPQ
jgi:hypothetical protein